MKAYLDSSVLLRKVLGEPGMLAEWKDVEIGVSSALIVVECLRTIDRLKLRGALTAKRAARHHTKMFELFDAIETVEISRPILSRASSSFPTPLGTLDAIHLSTALAYRDIRGIKLTLATHDKMLANAARAMGLAVIGV